MRLILLDIDGTLLLTGGLGQRSATRALKEVFGTSGRIEEFYPGGRTIEGIFADTLADAGIKKQTYLKSREQLYQVFLDIFKVSLESGEHQIQALPGAKELVQALHQRHQVMLGLATGNHLHTARLKLKTAGINPNWFEIGAYGHETADRSDLIPLAIQRAEDKLEEVIPEDSVIVVGDTTRDVESAVSVGAVSIALTTGTDNRALLETVEPDYIFNGLDNLSEILQAMGVD
jgi:phosphoglycolate phosphatase-like HAD superfamily hydrolase